MNEPTRARTPADESLGQRLIAGVLRRVMRMTLDRTLRADLPFEEQRRRLLMGTRLTLPPRGVTFASGPCGGVAGEWVRSQGHQQSALTILYLHGGGYCTGSPVTHRAVTGHLARRCGGRVFAADYRLAPEHPFPAGLDDAVTAYRGLLADGCAPRDIVVAGDSAGGGLTLAAALRLRELALPLPRALVLLSPWVDLSLGRLPPERPPGEVMLSLPLLGLCARSYAARTDVLHPLVSPLTAELQGLPPTLVQVGLDELLLSDSQRLSARLEASGVPVRLEEYARRWHVFQVNAGLLADADRAIDAVARFIRAA